MTKLKKGKKKGIADAVYAKKSAPKVNPFAEAADKFKKINPFEVHINKEKFNILGRTCKHDKGLPGVSRAKANKIRKETLEKEYRQQHKSNRFRDRRIGKYLTGDDLTEEVMNARFLAEKMSQMKQNKLSRFNLNDDEVLTHRGQTLEEIEQFRDERSDDEDEAGEKLDAEFTEAAHFGGDDNDGRDRKAVIDEMIVEQKRRKLEIAKEKDEVHNLTEQLDSNYKELLNLVGKMTKGDEKTKLPPDDYDKTMREMIFEPRGAVSDKLVSEEEQAKREKERLEQLEEERKKRMLEDGSDKAIAQKPQHRSADDLDDSYFAMVPVGECDTLTYNLDGKLHTGLDENEEETRESCEEEISEASGEENENEEEAEESDSDNEEEEQIEEDDLSDLKVSDSDSDENNTKKEKIQTKTKENTTEIKYSARTDLPFTIEMPETYEQFKLLLVKHAIEEQGILVERIIKCNHPKLEGINRQKVFKLFAYLLQYINERFADASIDNIKEQFKLLSILNIHLYDLMQLQPEKMSMALRNVIIEKHDEYKKNIKSFPTLETVIFFKLVSNFCSTSDFRHPVTTPSYIFLSQILSKARIRARQDIALGLFLVTIVLECTMQSKRFLPEALNFLLGIVFMSIPKRPVELIKIMPPFQSVGTMSKLLAIANDDAESKHVKAEPLQSEDLLKTHISLDFKVRALNTTLELIAEAMQIVKDNVGANYLAETFLYMLERLPLEVYPDFVRNNYDNTMKILKDVASKTLIKLTAPEKKPKLLRLLEPRIETVYNDKRRPKLSKEKEERVKLLHKVKRETKGAVREIRRDTQFLQKLRIKEQIQSDMERKEKVKRIYQEASMQQGELNELARAKKRKKF